MAISNFLKEFRSFAERGNAIDMAIGIIVGSVMTSVVNSLVKDVIMPPIGLLIWAPRVVRAAEPLLPPARQSRLQIIRRHLPENICGDTWTNRILSNNILN